MAGYFLFSSVFWISLLYVTHTPWAGYFRLSSVFWIPLLRSLAHEKSGFLDFFEILDIGIFSKFWIYGFSELWFWVFRYFLNLSCKYL
jgi:hypothetical protein